MASGNRNRSTGHTTRHQTKLTVVCADQDTLNHCPDLIQCTFGGILHKPPIEHREEGISLLSSGSIQIPYHCEFNIHYHGSDPDHFFNQFLKSCRLWCELCETYNWKLWMSTDMEAAYSRNGRTANVQPNITLQGFSLGCMADRWTFIEHYKHISAINPDKMTKGKDDDKYDDKVSLMDFEHDSQFFAIQFHCQSDSGPLIKYKLRVRYDDLQEFVLVDYQPQDGRILRLYFMLKAPPTFQQIDRRDKETTVKRVTRTCCCSTQDIGNSSVLSIHVSERSSRKFQSVISRLQVFKYKIQWTHVFTKDPVASATLPRFGGDFDLVYILECLLSQGFMITDRATQLFALLHKIQLKDHPAALKALQQLALQVDPTLEGDRFLDLADQFEINFKAARDNDDAEEDHYDNCRCVRRAIVTPTRCLLLPAELMAENRVLRQYGEEFCMRVVFRDETFGKLGSFDTSQGDEITCRVVDVLTSGIHIGDRCYDFLACSNSQLRDHGCWLYSEDLKGNRADNVRQWMGTFTNITCVATYVARMGQCFSTSEESVKVTVEAGQVWREDDIKSADGKYCFSDGIGRVSSSLAAKIAKVGNRKKKIPSAFQIRYAGCKGMIAIDPTLDGDKLIYRTSMEKFKSEHKTIEIMNNSKPCRLYLNRQAITLLSGLGVGDGIFKELQEGILYELGGMFFDDDVAAKSLSIRASQQTSINYRKVVEAGIRLTSEPYFRGLLLAVYRNSLGQLQRKARIEIPSHLGRNMIGVLDETGQLDYGQVFIQYSKNMDKPQATKSILTGTIVITKFPALAPGDMRKFVAIDVPELHHMVDCVVFPQRGRRPHPDEMAGSDLDGDEYFVTWMPGLVFDKPNEEPMDFTSPPKLRHDGPIEVSDMIKYIADYIKNDNVGLIANAHLAQADRTGIFSGVCISIAKKFSKAVDFAKTGYSPDLGREERPYMYPDFMGKRDKSTCRSEKILGHLYRQCRQIDRLAIQQKEPADVPPDIALEYPGRQAFQEDAKRSLNRYNRQLEAILTQYGITSESEALSGNIGRLSKRVSERNEIYDAKNIITLKVKHLWNKTRRGFFEEFGGQDILLTFPEECLAKASAWYMVTYEQRDKKYLSFPWVVSDVLCEVRKRNPNALTITVPSVMGRLAVEAEGYQRNASDTHFYEAFQEDPQAMEDLPILFHYLQENPWMRTTAGVLMAWRETQKLDKEVGTTELLVLLSGFAIQKSLIIEAGQQVYWNGEKPTQPDDHVDDEKPIISIKLLVEFFSFIATRMFQHEEYRYIPTTCQKPKLSKPHIRKLATSAEKAFHQLALCGTIHSILQVYDNSNDEVIQEFVTVGNDLFKTFTVWQGRLSNEFPNIGLDIRQMGQSRRPNGRVSIRGPKSQVHEIQDRIQEWGTDSSFFKEDVFDEDMFGDLDFMDLLANIHGIDNDELDFDNLL